MRHWFRYALLVVLPSAGALTGGVACSSSNDDEGARSQANGPGARNDAGVLLEGGGAATEGGSQHQLATGKPTIGFWCGLPESEQTKARFDEIVAAGFTHVSNACEAANTSYNFKMLDLAGQTGLVAIVSDARAEQALGASAGDRAAKLAGLVNDYGKHPAFFGYHVTDEPSATRFGAIAAVVSELAALDPKHPALINLLPTYASLAQLGAPSYDAYVGSYLQTAKPAVFSYDHYNFRLGGSDNPDFFENLAIVRAQSVATKTPFWQYIQSLDYVGHRATNGPEKRWAALHTLAYGGTGVMYFTYWTPPENGENFGIGIIGPDRQKSSQYADVQAINKTVAAMGRWLVPATSTAVFHNGPLDRATVPRAAGAPVYLPSGAAVTVGLFSSGPDTLALLVNRDYKATTETDVWVASADGAPETLDIASGQWTNATVLGTDPAKGAKLHLTLPPGDGVLLHLRGPLPAGAPGAEAFVGTVRSNSGSLNVVDSAFGGQRLGNAGWDDKCPTGYVLAGKAFDPNGFWLCARSDLAGRTFHVGNVVSDSGTAYRVQNGSATSIGPAGWDTCAAGKPIGRVFDSNGFWLCLE
jgi:hypothetical protein